MKGKPLPTLELKLKGKTRKYHRSWRVAAVVASLAAPPFSSLTFEVVVRLRFVKMSNKQGLQNPYDGQMLSLVSDAHSSPTFLFRSSLFLFLPTSNAQIDP